MKFFASTPSKLIIIASIYCTCILACKARKQQHTHLPVATHSADSLAVLKPPTSSDTATQVLIGVKEFYGRACGACHTAYAPQKYNKEQWQYHLNRMQKRAMISDKNKEDIYNYLVSVGQ